jgi:hypothetical protein
MIYTYFRIDGSHVVVKYEISDSELFRFFNNLFYTETSFSNLDNYGTFSTLIYFSQMPSIYITESFSNN